MDPSHGLPFLRATLLFLTLAGILIPLLQRFRINQVLGFLVVGIVFGPYGMGRWDDIYPRLSMFTFPRGTAVQSLAELGVVFLMFLIGLELSVERLWAMRRWVFLGGTAQVLLSALLIGALAWAFGNQAEVSVVLGLVLALSSTAVVMQLLSQQRAMATRLGQATFAILMLQDFAVVPLLILVDLLGRDGNTGFASLLGLVALKSLTAVALIFLLGRRLLGPVFRYFTRQRQPEVFVALTLLVALGIAGATAAVGLSLALGAFLAGLLLAETEFRHEVEVTIEPFKGLLMGLFFMAVGMEINLAELARHHVWIAASVLGLVLIKAAVAGGVLRLGGLGWGKSVEGGLLLSQGGEFAFVIVSAAAATKLLHKDVAQFMMLVVSLSLMVSTLVAKLGQRLEQRLDRRAVGAVPPGEDGLPEALAGHVVIAGFGRVGQLLAQVLDQQGVRYLAVEQDARVVARLRAQGRSVVYGNAARVELLRKLHTSEAAALLVTMDQPAAAMHTVRSARAEYPELPIFVRSRDEGHAQSLYGAGATAVVPETLESALQLTGFALQMVGVADAAISATIEAERKARSSH